MRPLAMLLAFLALAGTAVAAGGGAAKSQAAGSYIVVFKSNAVQGPTVATRSGSTSPRARRAAPPTTSCTREVRSASGALLSTLGTWTNANSGTVGVYSQKSLSLAASRGQTVRVQLRATTDFSLPTSFRIDDVSLK